MKSRYKPGSEEKYDYSCPQCGLKFSNPRLIQIFCSRECWSKNFWKGRRKKKPKPLQTYLRIWQRPPSWLPNS